MVATFKADERVANASAGADALERSLFYLGVGVATTLVVAFSLPMWQGRIYIRDDLGIAYGPMRYLFGLSLADGTSVLWTNALFGGHYIHAEGAVAMLHPLHPLLYRLFSFPTAFGLEILLTFVFALAGVYVFLRHWSVRRDAALIGGIVFAFSGFQSLHAVHPTMVAVAAHSPWLLWSIEMALFEPDRRRAARARLCVTLLIGSQLLLGHPLAFWISAVLAGLYVLFRLSARPAWRNIGALGVSAVLGVLIGSLQMLPMWEAVNASFRGPGMLNPFRNSLPPPNLVQLVAPYLTEQRVIGLTFTQEYGLYEGTIATLAAVWLIAGRRTSTGPHRLQRVGLGLAAVSILLMLGRYGPVYWIFTYLPVVGQFEHPAQYIVGLHLALAVLTALAFADLAERAGRAPTAEPRRQRALSAVVLASLLVAAFGMFSGITPEWSPGDGTRFASIGRILAGPFLVCCAGVLIGKASRGSRVALTGIVLFVGLDLGVYGLSYLRDPTPVTPSAAFEGQARPPDLSGRVQSYNNYLLFGGLQLTGGYSALNPRPILPELHPARLRLMGARWVQLRTPWGRGPSLSAKTEDAGHLLAGKVIQTTDGRGATSDWLRVDNPMPRARLVAHAMVSEAPARDLDAIDIARTALIAEPLDLGSGPPGTVQILDDRPGRIQVVVNAPNPQLLVLTETWHPGWTAQAGGRSIPCQPAYGSLLSCLVPPGQAQIDIRFFPPTLWFAVGAAAVGILGALIWFFVVIRSSRRSTAPLEPRGAAA